MHACMNGIKADELDGLSACTCLFALVMEENCIYDVAGGVAYNGLAGDIPSTGCDPCYDAAKYSSPDPQVVLGYNPCYDVAKYSNPDPQVVLGCNPCYDNAGTTAQVAAVTANLKAKKPARGCPCSWVCIGLVLVGVVACVSMAVAVWSIAEVQNISNSCKARQEDVEISEVMGQVNFIDKFEELNATLTRAIRQNDDQLNATLTDAINFLRENDDQLNATLTYSLQDADIFHNSVAQAIPGLLPSVPATSCLQVSLFPSGYYWVRASNGSAVRVYCDVTRSCGGVTGGWMRVARLDFNDTSTSCPSGLRERVDSGIRTCGIESPEAACPSVMFSTSGVEYTKVCGKILAYQFSSPDAFGNHGRGANPTIDSNYVDGVSLTHGHTPRNHIWTFAAARDEGDDDKSTCECSHSQSAGKSSPSFVGQDYFCDSGLQNYDNSIDRGVFSPNDPLWDGAGCGSESTCCSFNNPPWFHKELPSPTSDDIEMRVCCDEGRFNEDIALSSVEIYVQ